MTNQDLAPTLYDLLTPKSKKMLEAMQSHSPMCRFQMEKEFMTTRFWTELRYMTICDMKTFGLIDDYRPMYVATAFFNELP